MEVRITRRRVAMAALFVLAGVGLGSLLSPLVGNALATVGSVVNISDRSAAANFAKVDSTGKVAVGDGSGPLTVDGSTTSREWGATNALFRSFAFPNTTCRALATPPAGKALIIKSIALDTLSVTSPAGGGKFASFYVGTSGCQNFVMDINPSGVGLINQPFEPGLGVPAGQRLWVFALDISAEAFAFGYTVASSAVPASATSTSKLDSPQR
jgi:hypothetical protein